MISHEYPRVVIVTANPLRQDMPNGILLSSLFQGWPWDRLAQVYFPAGLSYLPEFDVCQQYSMIRTSGWVRRLSPPGQATVCPPVRMGDASVASSFVGGWKKRLLQQIKSHRSLLSLLRVGQEFWNAYSWIGRVLERELCHLRPEIVFADVGNFCLTRITCKACERLGIPLYLHVGDDYVRALYRGVPLERQLQALSEYWFRQAVSYADGLETVSPIAAEEFQRRYGGQWNWFTTLVNPDLHDASPRPPDDTIRMVYAGNLGIERWRSLRQLALVLKTVREEQGIRTCLDIYSTADQLAVHRHALDIAGITNLRDWVPREALPKVLHAADVLVHVESFDSSIAEYARFSFSTKISDYMMAGRCILSFGPGDLASMRMIRQAQAGITVDHTDSRALASTLVDLFRNPARREAMGRAGRAWAMTWLDQRKGREAFRQAIVAALTQARMRHEPQAGSVRRAA